MNLQDGNGGQADSTDFVTGDSGHVYFRDHSDTDYTVVTSRTSDGEDRSTHVHQLLACVEHDPHEVFADGNVVHHEAMSVYPVDVASNLTVMDAGEHARGHIDGTLEPTPIDEVLGEG